jgi:hypothetical protein
MEVDFPLNGLPGDRIVPEVFDSNGVPSPTIPEQQIPPVGTPGPQTLFFDLDDAFWAAVYADPNRQDEEQFTYRYRLIRPTISSDPVSQPEQFGILDRSYAGPEQPNLPDPLNPNIQPVAVQGAGTPVPAPNTLGTAQAGLDATMTWPLWRDPNRPVTDREIVTFYYQGKQVGSPVGVRGDQPTVTTTLPWATILRSLHHHRIPWQRERDDADARDPGQRDSHRDQSACATDHCFSLQNSHRDPGAGACRDFHQLSKHGSPDCSERADAALRGAQPADQDPA